MNVTKEQFYDDLKIVTDDILEDARDGSFDYNIDADTVFKHVMKQMYGWDIFDRIYNDEI